MSAYERLGRIEPWQTVVIQGCGPLGLFATALAKRSGAERIIMVGAPDSRLELACAWGSHRRGLGTGRGYYVRPTVFSGTNQDRIAREEVFGPVVVIIPFDDEEEAIRIANDSEFGLAGGVWAADREHARSVAARIRTGRVRINGAPIDIRAPHGGLKLSGIGRKMGHHGIEDFLDYQALHG